MSVVEKNIADLKALLDAYMAGDVEKFMAGIDEDFKGDILNGLVPAAENIVGKAGFQAIAGDMENSIEVKKYKPYDFCGVGDNVFFNVDWEFVYKPTGKTVACTAIVQKVMKDGKICEKYHRANTPPIVNDKPLAARAAPAPTDTDPEKNIALIQKGLAAIDAGNPAGYFELLHEDFHGDCLAGVVPGGEDIQGPAGFAKFGEAMAGVWQSKKFTTYNFCGVGDNVFFNADWEAVHQGKTVTCTAVVRKVIRDGKICEKYHRVNAAQIAKEVAPVEQAYPVQD